MNALNVNIHIGNTSLEDLEKVLKNISEIDRELQKIHPDIVLNAEVELS